MPSISSYLKNQLKSLNRIKSGSKSAVTSVDDNLSDIKDNPRPYEILNDRDGQLVNLQSFMADALNLQLELIKRALNLTTAAFLWHNHLSEKLHILGIRSDRQNTRSGPFDRGAGLTGALLKGRDAASIDHASCNYAGLVYYEEKGGIGSAMALRSPLANPVSPNLDAADDYSQSFFILCVDRDNVDAWTPSEKEILRLAVDKMSMERDFAKLLNTIEQERSIIQKICTGFKELNRGLDLESVFLATDNAIKNLMPVDCVAINLVKKDMHYIAFIRGGVCERFQGMEYEINEGLVGQVLKLNHSLPSNAVYNGDAPVFSSTHCLKGYRSLFIIPLRPEKGRPLGALTIASKSSMAFDKEQLDMINLIADQAAIKIDLAKSHELISKMATTDGLTSLANHRTFQHGFDIMLHRAKRRKSPLTMILCDIDYFKKFNDNYGHQFGDKVLKAVAAIMAAAIRKEDMAARYGGEEFALILENSDKRGAMLMAERIRKDIASLKFLFEGRQIGVTISLGIAAYPEDEQEKSQIIELADKALYKAKDKGRNQTVLA